MEKAVQRGTLETQRIHDSLGLLAKPARCKKCHRTGAIGELRTSGPRTAAREGRPTEFEALCPTCAPRRPQPRLTRAQATARAWARQKAAEATALREAGNGDSHL